MAKHPHRAEDRLIKRIDLARNVTGTNGIGKPYAKRAELDWKVLHALRIGSAK